MRARPGSRRRTIAVVGAVAAAVVLVGAGRVERSHAEQSQLDGIDRVRAAAHATGLTPDAYRLTTTMDCLLWRVGPDRFALELCYDLDGRLVEAIDRRPATAVFYDVTWSPGSARVRVPPADLSRTLRRMKAFAIVHVPPGVLPSGLQDFGPRSVGTPYRPLGG